MSRGSSASVAGLVGLSLSLSLSLSLHSFRPFCVEFHIDVGRACAAEGLLPQFEKGRWHNRWSNRNGRQIAKGGRGWSREGGRTAAAAVKQMKKHSPWIPQAGGGRRARRRSRTRAGNSAVHRQRRGMQFFNHGNTLNGCATKSEPHQLQQ